MFNIFFKYFFLALFFVVFCFMGVTFSFNFSEIPSINPDFNFSSSVFAWPTPGYTRITSYFGYRNAPTSGAGKFHSGIDIGASSGAEVIATFSGTVTYVGFLGANGFSIQISNGEYLSTYSHLSPHFLVYKGQYVNQGDIIGTVGPKNVYGVPNNPYKDSNGNPTNGATTGPHLHFSIKIDGKAVNPLNYFNI